MIGTQYLAAPGQRVLVEFAGREAVSDKTQVNREVVGGGKRTGMIFAEKLLEAVVGFPVHGQRLLEVAQTAQVTREPASRLQGMRVTVGKHFALLGEDLGVHDARVGVAALRAEHVGELESQVQGLPVIAAKPYLPPFLQVSTEIQRVIVLAAFPQVPHPVDKELAGFLLIAFVRFARGRGAARSSHTAASSPGHRYPPAWAWRRRVRGVRHGKGSSCCFAVSWARMTA